MSLLLKSPHNLCRSESYEDAGALTTPFEKLLSALMLSFPHIKPPLKLLPGGLCNLRSNPTLMNMPGLNMREYLPMISPAVPQKQTALENKYG